MSTKITVSQGADFIVNVDMIPCECDAMVTVNHGYGRTPYSINCTECKSYYDNIISCCTPEHALKSWNEWRTNPSNNMYKINKISFAKASQ